jgi:hypothetical protein
MRKQLSAIGRNSKKQIVKMPSAMYMCMYNVYVHVHLKKHTHAERPFSC